MRANPHLLRGGNVYWIRFFLLAVYATMYVRDHCRPMLHQEMGLESSTYDYEVFRITNEITKQVFPVCLDIDNPAFRQGLAHLFAVQTHMNAAKERGGLMGLLLRGRWALSGALTFVRLYFLPVKHQALPEQVRMVPAW
jgi:magnesium-protoporphyrin IX monomethyl ester (oxidative) cyclase